MSCKIKLFRGRLPLSPVSAIKYGHCHVIFFQYINMLLFQCLSSVYTRLSSAAWEACARVATVGTADHAQQGTPAIHASIDLKLARPSRWPEQSCLQRCTVDNDYAIERDRPYPYSRARVVAVLCACALPLYHRYPWSPCCSVWRARVAECSVVVAAAPHGRRQTAVTVPSSRPCVRAPERNDCLPDVFVRP